MPSSTPAGRWLDRTGAELREVPTDKEGIVDLDALAEACTAEVGLVSVMAVNNEIGTVQPIERWHPWSGAVARGGAPHRCRAGGAVARRRRP